MSRWQAIEVRVAAAGEPQRFRWRRHWYRVECILDQWQDQGSWWADEMPCWFFRVGVDGGGVFEVASDLDQHRWWLYRVYD